MLLPRRWQFLCLLALSIGLVHQTAAKLHNVAQMSVPELEDALQVSTHNTSISSGSLLATDSEKQCPIVKDLNRHKIDTNPQTSGLTSKIFAVLFPGSPAVNALLATLYISGPPSQYDSIMNLSPLLKL